MAEKLEKKIIKAPELPNVVKGDGRYLMSLLRSFLEQTAEQVNLANGFTADEINPDDNAKVPTPRNFTLTFSRLGARLAWDHLPDVSTLAYYELREDTKIGNDGRLLERTRENESVRIPITFVGTIYLYAVDKDGDCSNPARLNYTKARPEAPKDIALTKNNEGTLITYLEIPTNCIGANVYVNGVKYQTLDNIFLYRHAENMKIEKVEVAYYDVFGEGERGVVYCVLPDVTGFVVERNGPNLDFYWEALNIYGVQYVVKVGTEPSWDRSIEVFRTKLNKHRYVYPNTGDYYLLIKAMDEHNNFSANAAYFALQNAADISKNVILEFAELDTGYSGNKINLYYDAGVQGLKLERDANFGEYIAQIELPQTYRARNWCEFKVVGITNSNMRWIDMDFAFNSDVANNTALSGGALGDISGTEVRQQIARYTGKSIYDIEGVQMDGDLTADSGTLPTEALRATDFRQGRWARGLFVGDLTRLAYALPKMTQSFSLVCFLKKTEELNDCVLLTLQNAASFLWLGYDSKRKCFYLFGSDRVRLEAAVDTTQRDWLTFGISQGREERRLFVHSFGRQKVGASMAQAVPLGKFATLCCYPKLLL